MTNDIESRWLGEADAHAITGADWLKQTIRNARCCERCDHGFVNLAVTLTSSLISERMRRRNCKRISPVAIMHHYTAARPPTHHGPCAIGFRDYAECLRESNAHRRLDPLIDTQPRSRSLFHHGLV